MTETPETGTDEVARDVDEIHARGFVVIRGLLPPALLAEMRRALAPHLRAELLGRNDFEGHRTEHVYSLVGRAPVRSGANRRRSRAGGTGHGGATSSS